MPLHPTLSWLPDIDSVGPTSNPNVDLREGFVYPFQLNYPRIATVDIQQPWAHFQFSNRIVRPTKIFRRHHHHRTRDRFFDSPSGPTPSLPGRRFLVTSTFERSGRPPQNTEQRRAALSLSSATPLLLSSSKPLPNLYPLRYRIDSPFLRRLVRRLRYAGCASQLFSHTIISKLREVDQTRLLFLAGRFT